MKLQGTLQKLLGRTQPQSQLALRISQLGSTVQYPERWWPRPLLYGLCNLPGGGFFHLHLEAVIMSIGVLNVKYTVCISLSTPLYMLSKRKNWRGKGGWEEKRPPLPGAP